MSSDTRNDEPLWVDTALMEAFETARNREWELNPDDILEKWRRPSQTWVLKRAGVILVAALILLVFLGHIIFERGKASAELCRVPS